MSETVYRVQDDRGRGPFRPGFSATWADDSEVPHPPPFWVELGWRVSDVPKKFRDGETGGTGCRSLEQLARWFTPTERTRLAQLGYSVVRMSVDRVLGESETQIVFARNKPLRWDVVHVPWTALKPRSQQDG